MLNNPSALGCSWTLTAAWIFFILYEIRSERRVKKKIKFNTWKNCPLSIINENKNQQEKYFCLFKWRANFLWISAKNIYWLQGNVPIGAVLATVRCINLFFTLPYPPLPFITHYLSMLEIFMEPGEPDKVFDFQCNLSLSHSELNFPLHSASFIVLNCQLIILEPGRFRMPMTKIMTIIVFAYFYCSVAVYCSGPITHYYCELNVFLLSLFISLVWRGLKWQNKCKANSDYCFRQIFQFQ